MASTLFIDKTTPIIASWLNDVNAVVYADPSAPTVLDLSIRSETASTVAVIGDRNNAIEITSGSATSFTIPPNSSVAFPTGSQLVLTQLGAGQVTVAAGVGVTIRSSGSKVALADQYSVCTLYKAATDIWQLQGNLV